MRGYDVASREPDPRGWKVVNRERRHVGEVKDLIVDADRMVATYLEVELDRKMFDLSGDDPHVLVPVDRAHVEGHRLVVDEIAPGWFGELRAAREAHRCEFWDRWWHPVESHPERRGPQISRSADSDELNRVIDTVRPGETVRIPVVEEEIIVERRLVSNDEALRQEHMLNETVEQPSLRR
jgi:sporulation protein YlmC with PRC-barrel domain